MKKILILIIWLISILVSIVWTYENPEKIKKIKDILKYDFLLGKIFKNLKSNVVNERLSSINDIESFQIDTAYNHIELEYFRIPVYSSYGGIAQINGGILYLSGDVDFFLTDSRTSRSVSNGTYLGEKQTAQLKRNLKSSKAIFKIIVSGSQVINPLSDHESYLDFYI